VGLRSRRHAHRVRISTSTPSVRSTRHPGRSPDPRIPRYELPPEQATPLRRRLAEIEAERARACEPAPGCGELLEALAHRGAELGILTRNTRQNARYALAAIGALPYFTAECILGRDEAAPKPDPDGILKLARHHDRPADRGVMVGDFRLDLEAGRAAGCLTVHVAGDGPRWPELTDIGVQNLHELTALLP
jgi:phosphoglycolate phosphatase-like HAD superfamily hydrolase